MQTRLIPLVLVTLAVSTSVALSQETRTATNSQPRRTERSLPPVSPELLPDGGVTFRLRAPKASEVKAVGQFGPETAMAKDTQGVWSVTVPKVPVGVHEYHFVVDGLNILDPQNPAIKPQRW